MSRLERKIKKSDFDAVAVESGWHRGIIQPFERTVNYYNGPNYVTLRFSPWLYDLSSILWWDNTTSKINIYDRHDGDILLGVLTLDIFRGRIDPSDKEAILRYTVF